MNDENIKMDDITNTLYEVRDNGRQILNRCNQLLASEPKCQCEAILELSRKELHDLKTRVTDLENNCKRKRDETENLSESINSLKQQLETIQRTLQTDDVKLINKKSNHVPVVEHADSVHVDRGTAPAADDDNQDNQVQPENFDNATEFDTSDEDNWSGTKFARKGIYTDITKPGLEGATASAESPQPSTSDTRDESKPNEDEVSQTPPLQVEVVKQVKQRVVFGDIHWRNIAQDEFNESSPLFYELDGYHTILCVDISESMLENDGWEQASTFVRDFLNGLNDFPNITRRNNEHVVLVTFGHETAVKQRFTNDYVQLLQVFDGLKLGGPSSLYGGLLLSHAAVSSSRFIGTRIEGDLILPQRIVIITDGRPTDINIIAGPDTLTSNNEQAKRLIVDELLHPNVVRYDIFVIPVGNVDTEFIDTMVGVSGGMRMEYTHGTRFSRRHYLSSIAAEYGGDPLLMRLSMFSLSQPLTVEDQEDISSILERSKRCLETMDLVTGPPKDCYHEKPRSQLPTIGSRVRRGPDWKWSEEDGSGPGTAIGHAKETDEVWVEWDQSDPIKKYRYGDTGYDILIVDEPRELQDGRLLAVGCSVKPGKCWKKAEPKPRRGVVIKIDTESKTATVRWDNARRGDFRVDLEEGELEYCPTLERHSEDSELPGARYEAPPSMYSDKRNKNNLPKTKNMH